MKKKLKGKVIGWVIFILAVIIIVVILWKLGILNFKGIGNGGDGEAVQANADITVSDEITGTETETSVVQEKIPLEITINGEEYLYNNNSYSLDNLMTEISKIEGEFEVHISLSDTATLAARENLEARLDEENILHNIVEKAE